MYIYMCVCVCDFFELVGEAKHAQDSVPPRKRAMQLDRKCFAPQKRRRPSSNESESFRANQKTQQHNIAPALYEWDT